MTKIAMLFTTTTGIPIGDALVEVRLTRSDYDEAISGVLMTRMEEFRTAADGSLLVDLMPCDTLYHVTVYDTVQDIAIHHDFLVPEVPDPNTVLRLQDLIVPPDTVLSSMPFDVEAMQKIQLAKAEAQAAATEAKAAAELAQGAIDTTTENAAITTADRIAIESMRNGVSADALEVRQNTVLVADYTGDALQHKIDAQAAAAAAALSATSAEASEQQTIQSAAAAEVSKTTATNAATNAQNSAITANTAKDQAVAARDITVAAKDVTVDAKNVTLQKAAELEAQLYAFNEIYIGKFAEHPTVDGNGNPLKIGAIYENTTEGKLYQYESDLQWHPYDEESQQQMNNALLSANSAAASAGSATASMNAAETARLAAVAAKTSAETAATTATNSAATAVAAKDATVAAKDTAVAAKDTASQKAVDAAASAAAAAASAAIAADYQIPSDWTQTDNTKKDYIKNKPVLATVATTGNKADVGLGNADNTSDANKPISIATAAALAGKAALAGSPTQPFNVSSLNGGPLGGIRNKLLNPTFRINQRVNTSTTSDNTYIADCWRTGIAAGVGTLATLGVTYDGPVSANGFLGMYALTGPVAKPVLSASDYVGFGTAIEGFDWADTLYGTASAKTITLSFRARATANTVISVCFRNASADRYFVAPVAIAAGFGTYSVTVPGDTAGTWFTDNRMGISVWFFTACGTEFHTTTPNAWASGNKFGHSSMSNTLDTANRYVHIADPQLEIGTSATPLIVLPHGMEIARCQRYFENVQGIAAEGYVTGGGTPSGLSALAQFKVSKRVPPTITTGATSSIGCTYGGLGTTTIASVLIRYTGTATGNATFTLNLFASADM